MRPCRTLAILPLLLAALLVGCDSQPEPTPAADTTGTAAVAQPVKGGNKKGSKLTEPEQCDDTDPGQFTFSGSAGESWVRPLQEVIDMPGHVTMTDKKHEGRQGMPLAALLEGQPEPGTVVLTGCGNKKTAIDAAEILANPGGYILTINRRGYMKLARQINDEKFVTDARFLYRIEILPGAAQ